jgi:hypothetical protein
VIKGLCVLERYVCKEKEKEKRKRKRKEKKRKEKEERKKLILFPTNLSRHYETNASNWQRSKC